MTWKMAATSASKESRQEHLYKILVIGEFGVGKTSIIRRYTEGSFSPNYKLTIGVDFALKLVNWSDNTKINLQLWDIAGHERFGHMTRVYYKYAIAAIIVFDLSRPATFDSVSKCDLTDVHIDTNRLNRFCEENSIIGWFPTSAKNNENIDEAMKFLIEKILELPSESQQPSEHISLSMSVKKPQFDDSFEMDKETPKPKDQCCS
ncbi:ras-related protein Rab-32B-like isoform X2 [Crassostrea angulata]|uniref:ras-related protein Rab-32B-like isoform X2 n=1 Tax=Magallana angulata TaxID=2784310 RepID=UPI0022B1B58F|nr:ras-related protein Rab-32B-like isoform X2 [Crassostrea angulata]